MATGPGSSSPESEPTRCASASLASSIRCLFRSAEPNWLSSSPPPPTSESAPQREVGSFTGVVASPPLGSSLVVAARGTAPPPPPLGAVSASGTATVAVVRGRFVDDPSASLQPSRRRPVRRRRLAASPAPFATPRRHGALPNGGSGGSSRDRNAHRRQAKAANRSGSSQLRHGWAGGFPARAVAPSSPSALDEKSLPSSSSGPSLASLLPMGLSPPCPNNRSDEPSMRTYTGGGGGSAGVGAPPPPSGESGRDATTSLTSISSST